MAVLFTITTGEIILLDDEDITRVADHRWYAHRGAKGRLEIYAYLERTSKYTKTALPRFLLGCPEGARVSRQAGTSNDDYRKACFFSATITEVRKRSGKTRGLFTSRYKGVYRFNDIWRATISVGKKTLHLGLFDNEEEAARAYDRAAREKFGADCFQNLSE